MGLHKQRSQAAMLLLAILLQMKLLTASIEFICKFALNNSEPISYSHAKTNETKASVLNE